VNAPSAIFDRVRHLASKLESDYYSSSHLTAIASTSPFRTPFLDNYPTFEYIRKQRRDDIPSLIDRSFYAYTCEGLASDVFEDRFKQFQGANDQVQARYVCSDFIQSNMAEMDVLRSLFHREMGYHDGHVFNVCVDLVGLFKTTTVHDIRTMLLDQFGLNGFHYVYHIDQTDNSDRVLCLETANDSCFDEEWYKFGLKRYGKELPRRVFFFIDNRNVIGKDVPFQLAFLRDFASPLFSKSLVLAHDVDDFSKSTFPTILPAYRTCNGTGHSRTLSVANDLCATHQP
jgi:hypothetical protein